MNVRIAGAAARMVIGRGLQHGEKIQKGQLIPVIVWIIADSHPESAIPRLGTGFIEREAVPPDRLAKCDDFECEIAVQVPDDILAKYRGPQIDLREGELVLSEN